MFTVPITSWDLWATFNNWVFFHSYFNLFSYIRIYFFSLSYRWVSLWIIPYFLAPDSVNIHFTGYDRQKNYSESPWWSQSILWVLRSRCNLEIMTSSRDIKYWGFVGIFYDILPCMVSYSIRKVCNLCQNVIPWWTFQNIPLVLWFSCSLQSWNKPHIRIVTDLQLLCCVCSSVICG